MKPVRMRTSFSDDILISISAGFAAHTMEILAQFDVSLSPNIFVFVNQDWILNTRFMHINTNVQELFLMNYFALAFVLHVRPKGSNPFFPDNSLIADFHGWRHSRN